MELALSLGGKQVTKFQVFLSVDLRLWVKGETLKSVGFTEQELKGFQERKQTLFLEDENEHYYRLAILMNSEVEVMDYLTNYSL